MHLVQRNKGESKTVTLSTYRQCSECKPRSVIGEVTRLRALPQVTTLVSTAIRDWMCQLDYNEAFVVTGNKPNCLTDW